MPAAIPPAAKMRERSKHNQKRLTAEEKELIRERKEKKKNAIPTWLVWFMLFVVLGSTIVQIYFSIESSPKMTD